VPSQIVATLSAQHKVDGSCIWRDIAEVRRTWRETAAPMLMEHRRDEYREAGRRGYNMAITERDEKSLARDGQKLGGVGVQLIGARFGHGHVVS